MKKSVSKLTVIVLTICSMLLGSVGAFATSDMASEQSQLLSALTTEQITALTAIMKTLQAENSTITIDVSIALDGEEMITGVILMQNDADSQYSSYALQMADEAVDMESYTTGGVTITRDGDEYTMEVTLPAEEETDADTVTNEAESETENTDASMIMDLLALMNTDGDTITIDLTGDDIPDVLLEMVFSMIPAGDDAEAGDTGDALNYMEMMQIDSIHLEATVADTYLSEVFATIRITLENEEIEANNAEMAFAITFTEIGTTLPGTIDTTGKTVTEIIAEE